MNFENFPALKQPDALLITELFMGLLVIALGSYFWINRYLTLSKARSRGN